MKKNEIETILSMCLEKEEYEYSIPSNEDWKKLEKKVDFMFPETFKTFIDFMSVFSFPGDIYNVLEDNNNGNDSILQVYMHECQYPEWDKSMIPFYGIGNGDYFCICKNDAKIYYYYQDELKSECYSENMDDWILDIDIHAYKPAKYCHCHYYYLLIHYIYLQEKKILT